MGLTVGNETTQSDDVLVARGIRKSFDGVEVLHGVDFIVSSGEIHGIVGQNGAGKSTLVKILNGAYSKDDGVVLIKGTPTASDVSGHDRSVSLVYQELSLIPGLTVGQNILLNHEPARFGVIDAGELDRRARFALEQVGADIDTRTMVADLPVGARHLVEIAKAISTDASVLILDEPTASLPEAEIASLMRAIRRSAEQGIAVVYISHHLEEVMSICDRITVLRDGWVTLSTETSSVSTGEIIESMLGRKLEQALAWHPNDVDRTGPPLLRASGLSNVSLAGISFELHRGEILGVAGLLGSGRSELARAVFGIDALKAGSIDVDGRRVVLRSPHDALSAGISLVPEDRGRAGLVIDHSVRHNMLMAAWDRFRRGPFLDDRAGDQAASGFVKRLRIKTDGLGQQVRRLSGGNQQKVVVAKSLSVEPLVLILDDPTVGIDVGSRLEILMELRALAAGGTGVLLISSELEELSALADRVLLMRGGRIARTLERRTGDDLSEEGLSRAIQET